MVVLNIIFLIFLFPFGNVFSIVVIALIMSFVTDYIYTSFSLPVNFKVEAHEHAHTSIFDIILTVFFVILLLRSLLLKELPKTINKLKNITA